MNTTSVNVRGTLNVNREQGKCTGSFAAYGYLNENGEVTERFGQILLDGGKYKYQAQ